MNPLPYTNRIENIRKIVFATLAFAKALTREKVRFSVSAFSFEKTIKPSPVISNNMVSSSAKFVLNVAKIFISANAENTANTGMVNLKSNQMYSAANNNPSKRRKMPANFEGYGNNNLFIQSRFQKNWIR